MTLQVAEWFVEIISPAENALMLSVICEVNLARNPEVL